ncbi:Membrane-anchored ubiquitin-fold protein 3 [Zostera marina]|uniref:Membrane-anchored ubiquitin-fold protein n=1 Tax=Zostera marina TaxID=29655 RepID=A0A0K9PJ93_ZOSMR|nr:Membrane-anchored ubiquitin-fold protein 3 [Zostera marina]
MATDDSVDLKFRLFDGTDIGPTKYDLSTSVTTLKQIILSIWPQDKKNGPKTINDLKLINGGKILENNHTLAEARLPLGELPGGVITMHVVVRPLTMEKSERNDLDIPKTNRCVCCIM